MADVTKVSERVERRILGDFPEPGSATELIRLLSDVELGDVQLDERVQAAIVLSAQGSVDQFRDSLELARIDWRDVLVRGDLAHEDWWQRLFIEFGPPD